MTARVRPIAELALRPAAIVSAALLLRLVWLALVPVVPVSDSVMYQAFADSIASGVGYAYPGGKLTSYWPVGASAVYAAVYAVFGKSNLAIAVLQAFLGAFIVGLTWRLARRYLDARGAALAGWATALWPLLIEFTTILASELIFIALTMLALNVWTTKRLPLSLRAALWGACIAGATYVRPTAWPLLLIFPALSWLFERRARDALLTCATSVFVAALLFAPWVQRNFALYGQFVLVATNGGPNLWMGNNPESTGSYMPLPEKDFGTEVERDRTLGHEAVQYIIGHPLTYLRLSIRRTIGTYDRESIGVVWNEAGLTDRFGARVLQPLKLVSTAYWWLVLLAGAYGTLRVLRTVRPLPWPLLAALLFFAIVPILTVSQDRYHVPINPLLSIFGAWGIMGVARPRGVASMQPA